MFKVDLLSYIWLTPLETIVLLWVVYKVYFIKAKKELKWNSIKSLLYFSLIPKPHRYKVTSQLQIHPISTIFPIGKRYIGY